MCTGHICLHDWIWSHTLWIEFRRHPVFHDTRNNQVWIAAIIHRFFFGLKNITKIAILSCKFCLLARNIRHGWRRRRLVSEVVLFLTLNTIHHQKVSPDFSQWMLASVFRAESIWVVWPPHNGYTIISQSQLHCNKYQSCDLFLLTFCYVWIMDYLWNPCRWRRGASKKTDFLNFIRRLQQTSHHFNYPIALK